MTLYSYTIPFDDGAAPNPYWDTLTLAICKPVIRRKATKGDWVVATGSKNSPIGNIQKSIVYVMEVTDKMTLKEYDKYCKTNLPNKIPDTKSKDLRRHVGDCIYNYSATSKPVLRKSVHIEENIKTDLGGLNVLLSNNFYYFGDHPLFLPKQFQSIIKENQGHKSKSNAGIASDFVAWIKSLAIKKNTLVGKPQITIDFTRDHSKIIKCAKSDIDNSIKDEIEFRKKIC